MKAIERIYPGSKIRGIDQIFIGGKGWIDVCSSTEYDAMDMIRAERTPLGVIEVFAIILEDQYGIRRVADFKRAELMEG